MVKVHVAHCMDCVSIQSGFAASIRHNSAHHFDNPQIGFLILNFLKAAFRLELRGRRIRANSARSANPADSPEIPP